MRTRAHLVIKTGAHGAIIDADHFRGPMARATEVVLEEAPALPRGELVITSGKDSHSKGRHPKGWGIDFRGNAILAPNLKARRERGQIWAARVQARLGSDYVAIFEEHKPATRDHLHVEWKPRPRARFMPGFFARIGLAQKSEPLP